MEKRLETDSPQPQLSPQSFYFTFKVHFIRCFLHLFNNSYTENFLQGHINASKEYCQAADMIIFTIDTLVCL